MDEMKLCYHEDELQDMRRTKLILCGLLIAGGIHAADQPIAPQFKKWEPYPVWEERDVPNPNPGQDRPNVLWITCEDISPFLGCFGFEQALTPNLDKLAENGVRYTRAYAAATVCAVARSSLLTGMYSPTIGTHGMRVRTTLPPVIEAYPALFKKAGYFCTNNWKTDYNSNPYSGLSNVIWDQCGGKREPRDAVHWKNRPDGKPFFAVFNYGGTHESHMRVLDAKVEKGELPPEPRIPLEEVKLPAYHPDLPEIRHDWARLHELITLMDKEQGDIIQEVIDAGLWDDTIVVFYSDHGGMLSRSKRYIYNGGTQVPLIVRVPEKWKHLAPGKPGTANDEFVQFIDLPKTMLKICGIDVPEVMQGRVFMGPDKEPAPETITCYRDRQSERFDCSRAITDGEHYLIRNFYPHRPRGRDTRYGYTQQANWRAWEAWHDGNPEAAGPVFSQFYKPKPLVELFDMEKDPDQVKNLAADPALKGKLEQLSAKLDAWMIENRDLGVVPEPMLFEMTGDGKKYATLYEYGQSLNYPVEKILAAAKAASSRRAGDVSKYLAYMKDKEPLPLRRTQGENRQGRFCRPGGVREPHPCEYGEDQRQRKREAVRSEYPLFPRVGVSFSPDFRSAHDQGLARRGASASASVAREMTREQGVFCQDAAVSSTLRGPREQSESDLREEQRT